MNILVMDYVGDRAIDMKQGNQIYAMILEGFKKGSCTCGFFRYENSIVNVFK